MPRSRRQRGYPMAVLIGLENKRALFWEVYSNQVKPGSVKVWQDNEYNFFESLVDELRPYIKRGMKTVILASESGKKIEGFMGHIEKHQSWMVRGYELNRVTFQVVEGSAGNVESLWALINAAGFREKINKGVDDDLKLLISELKKRLSTDEGIDSLMFSLDEVENAVYNGNNIEYILVSRRFLDQHRRRMQRLLQVAEKREIKTRVLSQDSPQIGTINQFGGMICLLQVP
jgi:stalled ribosome rescue protein Dom34